MDILVYFSFAIWLAWVIGYPIYKHTKHERVYSQSSPYSVVMLLLALLINLLNLIRHLVK